MKLYMICDESGAKGYADRNESFPGETGVFAGVMVPEDKFKDYKEGIEEAALPFFSDDKCHLASLSNEDMPKLREAVYACLDRLALDLVYEAVHVEGFNREFVRMQELEARGRELSSGRYKVGGEIRPESLHEKLFEGLFCKALAYCIDKYGDDFELVIIPDRVDESIFKKFIKNSENFKGDLDYVRGIKSYDTQERKLVQGTLKFEFTVPEEYGFDEIENAEFEIQKDSEGGCLTLPADILSNHICYLFHSREGDDIGKPLNNTDSVVGHLLAHRFCGLANPNGYPWFPDWCYAYPKDSDF